MTSNTITSLAILKVNWESKGTGYLENFTPIIAECVRLSGQHVISVPRVQGDLKEKFGLEIPQNTVESLLRKLKRKGYLTTVDRVYRPNFEALNKTDFKVVQQQVVQAHETLLQEFVSFCSDKFALSLTTDEAENALQSYLEENQLAVLGSTDHASVVPRPSHPVKNYKYLVASFVQNLKDTYSASLNHLETVAKGNMLANGIFLPEPAEASRKFRDTEVYFDTTFLIYALGDAGPQYQGACIELLNLLKAANANLRCFRHTHDEIRGVLEACEKRLASGDLRTAYGPSMQFFLEEGHSSTDVAILANNLESRLNNLNIRLVDTPEYKWRPTIYEASLDEILQEKIGYSNVTARERDVKSVSAIAQLRGGNQYFLLESCVAVFVTTNTKLTRVVRDFFSEEMSLKAIAPLINDYTLTNLMWLKDPTQEPDLPWKRIIADCYAATQPDERLWTLYVEEIRKLEQRNQVSAEDYYLLRYQKEYTSTLMDVTQGNYQDFVETDETDERALAHGTVDQILQRIEEDKKEQLSYEVEKVQESEQQARTQIASLNAEKAERDERVEARARKYSGKLASAVAKILTYGLIPLIILGTVVTIVWGIPALRLTVLGFIVYIAIVAAIVFQIYVAVYGGTIVTMIGRIERAVYTRVLPKVRHFLES